MKFISLISQLEGISERMFVSHIIQRSWEGYLNADVSLEEISVLVIEPLARTVEGVRMSYAEELIFEYNKRRIEAFDPVILLVDGAFRLILPPVLEQKGDRYFIMDGMHRILRAKHMNLNYIRCIVVNPAIKAPLPIEPCDWSTVQLIGNRTKRANTFPKYNKLLFRETAEYLDKNLVRFESIGEMIRKLSSK